MRKLKRWLPVVAGVVVAVLTGMRVFSQEPERPLDVPYVPTPQVVVDAMLKLADVKKNDIVYDLGCGDGRIVITAAKNHGIRRGVGVDIDPQRIKESKENAAKAGVTDRVEFFVKDLFETDIREATVMTLYLLPDINLKLRPRLFRDLKPGTRIVSHDFSMGDWKPDKKETVNSVRAHTLYFWIIPADVKGAWQFRVPGVRSARLDLTQQFQEVSGTATVDGRKVAITDAKLTGDQLSFSVPGQGQRGAVRFSGRVTGDTLKGSATMDGGRKQEWTAKRSGTGGAARGTSR